MEDFYTTFVGELPRDEWGHPVLPTPEKITRREYATSLLTLQIELVKMQQWARANGERVLLLFEGRDTAGKGGTIQRIREHMNPRFAAPCRPSRPQRDGGRTVVLPALRRTAPDRAARSRSSIVPGTTGPASNASCASRPTTR